MSGNLPSCPKCNSIYTYEGGSEFICPECAYEWTTTSSETEDTEKSEDEKVVTDANGNVLADGDHDIDCKIDGIGAMKLKSEFVKKA